MGHRIMGAFYFASTDEQGVLCVDQLAGGQGAWSPENVAALADRYPNVVYFWHWAGA